MGVVAAGCLSAHAAPVNEDLDAGTSAYQEVAVLTEALMLVKRRYVEELSYRDILYGALDGMLSSLDPHSSFLGPEHFVEFKKDTEGTFAGIGIELGLRDGALTIIAPLDGSPAYRAGLVAGDKILKIDGRSTSDFSMQQVSDLIKGKVGETLALQIGRDRQDPFSVHVTRDQVVVPSVRGARVIRSGVGYARITKFDGQTMPAFRERVEELLKKGIKGLILDLRSNPGGLLTVGVEVAECFLDRDKEIVSIRGREGLGDSIVYKSAGLSPFKTLHLAVLVDEGSASASEVVAGALKDHHRAVLVGSKTYGKASVQNVIPLKTNPELGLRLTTAHYYTPLGGAIHGVGIKPDIDVPVDPRDRARVQMKRAYEEQPEMFDKPMPKEFAGVVDAPLERAADVISALLVLREGGLESAVKR